MGQGAPQGLLSSARIEEAFARHSVGREKIEPERLEGLVGELLRGLDASNVKAVLALLKAQQSPMNGEEFKERLVEALDRVGGAKEGGVVGLSQSLRNVSREDVDVATAPPPVAAPLRFDPNMAANSGHVFILLTDMRKLACDCFCIPTGPSLVPGKTWICAEDPVAADLLAKLGPVRSDENQDVRIVPNWPTTRGQPICVSTHAVARAAKVDQGARPKVVPTKTTSNSSVMEVNLEWVHRALALFLDAAKTFCSARAPLYRRGKPLIALPLLGSGGAGARGASGQLIREMLPVLYGWVNANNMDVALCSVEKTQWAVMQLERRRFDQETSGWVWCSLPPNLKEEAERLANHAKEDQLVLFLGAGCSVGAGLPSWVRGFNDLFFSLFFLSFFFCKWPSFFKGALLEKLARRGNMSDEEVDGLKSLNFLDQARLVGKRLGGTQALAQAIATEVNSPLFSLVHALLASLPIRECVTTNYDPCFETASRLPAFSSQPAPVVAVLPWAPAANCDRWLLKIHGCVNHPEEIVLTREDYLRYETRRAALTGVLQSLLITKHVLFVGFSLNDDNFHKSVDSVRRATGDGALHRTFGTALFLLKERFMDELWGADLNILPMRSVAGGGAPAAKDWSESARMLEIFLDFVASLTVERGLFFRDPKFDYCLNDADIAFRESLENYLDEITQQWGTSSPFVQMFKGSVEKTFGQRLFFRQQQQHIK